MVQPASPAPLWRLVLRALTLRCPRCGEGRVMRTWLRGHERCAACGLAFERQEQGYVVGTYMFNLIAAELLFAAVFVLVAWRTWPDPPWALLQYGGALGMVVMPLLFYPFAKTLFLAFDLVFRPREQDR